MDNEADIELTPKKNALIEIIKKVKLDPHSEELWTQAVELANQEEQSLSENGKKERVSIEEMVEFGEKIKASDSIKDKYNLLSERNSKGRLWYDVLLGDGNDLLFEPVKQLIKKRVKDTGRKYKEVADLGTGTGNTVMMIYPFGKHITGVDIEKFALDIAKEDVPSNVDLVQGTVNELPFTEESLDLVVSNGLTYYLSRKETKELVNELKRVIKPGGEFFLQVHIKDEDEILPKISSMALESAYEALIYLIGELTTEGGHPDSMSIAEINNILVEEGFDSELVGPDENDVYVLKLIKRN